jgi:aminoglycoside phosphotransferase (APT) family kinase protein
VTGLIDFEASFIGDARYDLAKLTWNELNFPEPELTWRFGTAWAAAANDTFDLELHAYYECLQALAAVAWVDRQRREPASDDGVASSTRAAFRARALERLRAAW